MDKNKCPKMKNQKTFAKKSSKNNKVIKERFMYFILT
jgi:hypothetical protein